MSLPICVNKILGIDNNRSVDMTCSSCVSEKAIFSYLFMPFTALSTQYYCSIAFNSNGLPFVKLILNKNTFPSQAFFSSYLLSPFSFSGFCCSSPLLFPKWRGKLVSLVMNAFIFDIYIKIVFLWQMLIPEKLLILFLLCTAYFRTDISKYVTNYCTKL